MAEIVGAASAAVDWGVNPTVSVPAGTATGDLLIAVLVNDGDGAATDLTTPSGWTLLSPTFNGGGSFDPHVKVVWRESAGASSYTFTRANSGNSTACAAIIAITGQDPDTPLPVSLTWGNGAGTSIAAPAATGVDGGLLLSIHATAQWNSVSYSMTPPSGMDELVDVTHSEGWCALSVASDEIGSGSTGSRAATQSGASIGWAATQIVIAPAEVISEPEIEPGRFLFAAS